MKRSLTILITLLSASLAFQASNATAAGSGRPAQPKRILLPKIQVGGFLAVDAHGNIYSDAGTTSIVKLSPAGKLLTHWDGLGVETDRPDVAGGLALDGHGHLYAVDTDANQVLEMSTNLKVLARWGGFGGAPGQFVEPEGIALDARGNLLVADMGNGRIQKLSPAGTVLAVWDNSADFRDPRDVAVGRRGDIFVADVGNDRIMELSPDGRRLATWAHRQFFTYMAAGLAADRAGNVYVSGGQRDGSYRLAHNRRAFSYWAFEPFNPYRFAGITTSPQGSVYVSECPSDASACRIVKLSAKGAATTMWYSGVPPVATGEMVGIGGYRLYLRCIGQGSPTVVFDSGNGDPGVFWSYAQSQVGTHTRVCSYDRAGNGKSDPRPGNLAPSGLQIAHELHALLQAAGISGPYILAGHSLGGIFVRAFAGTYPTEVVGMVLVDASSENQWADPTKGTSEIPDMTATVQQMHALTHGTIKGSLGDLPLAVLTEHGGQDTCWDCIPNPQFWYGLQAELASASSNSVHVMALRSGHYMQLDQPGLVVQAVNEVLDAARAQSHALPACGTTFQQLGGACE